METLTNKSQLQSLLSLKIATTLPTRTNKHTLTHTHTPYRLADPKGTTQCHNAEARGGEDKMNKRSAKKQPLRLTLSLPLLIYHQECHPWLPSPARPQCTPSFAAVPGSLPERPSWRRTLPTRRSPCCGMPPSPGPAPSLPKSYRKRKAQSPLCRAGSSPSSAAALSWRALVGGGWQGGAMGDTRVIMPFLFMPSVFCAGVIIAASD